MTDRRTMTMDGNEAAASVAHRMSEVIRDLSDHAFVGGGRAVRRAHVTQMVSALLMHGPAHLRTVLTDLAVWMQEHEWDSLERCAAT